MELHYVRLLIAHTIGRFGVMAQKVEKMLPNVLN